MPAVTAASCQDSHVFSFKPGDEPCRGLDEVLQRYRCGIVLVCFGCGLAVGTTGDAQAQLAAALLLTACDCDGWC